MKEFLVTIPDYIEEVKVSEKRRTKYYSATDAIPKRLQKKIYFDKGIAHDSTTKEPIIKNIKTAGKPRFEKVNFQKIYNGAIARQLRAKLIDRLHDYYAPYLKNLPVIQLEEDERVVIYYEFHNVFDNKSQDVDNHCHLHIKASLDCLTTKNNPNQKDTQKLGIIPDDTRRYVKGIYYDITDVADIKDKKLVMHIWVVNKDFKLTDYGRRTSR